MITWKGMMYIPEEMVTYAETIKHENYKTNTPKKFQKHAPSLSQTSLFLQAIGVLLNINPDKLDMVYFSVVSGAEPHIDLLDKTVFTNDTYIIPIILPKGKNIITAGTSEVIPILGNVYHFDHTKIHGMTVENETGCVVLMIAVKH